ncbi:MAG: PEGA domain-containing protein [Cellvibrionaceae bacterium]
MTQQEEIPNINTQQNSSTDDDFIQPLDFQPASHEVEKEVWKPTSFQIAMAATLVIALVVLSYLFAAKSLYVRSNVDNAQVEVDGIFTLSIGDRFLLLKGEHQVSLESQGYYPHQESVEINSDDNQYFDVTLKPLPGHLDISSNTLAQVFLNGEAIGDTSQPLKNIDAGPHQLSLKAERYQTLEVLVDIEGKEKTQTLDVNLQPNWADISINSNPSGATVFSEDTEIGTTPLTAELLAGKRNLTVKLDGHKSWRQSIRVTAQEAKTLPDITLVKADGLVDVISKPAGASVTVNGQFRGKTPVEVALSPGNRYQFTLFKDGYQPLHKQLRIESNKAAQINVTLKPNLGDITIQASPGDALLYVDGVLMGRANQSITLPAKKHTLRITKDGYADHSETVLPRQGFEQKLAIKLLTNEEYKWKNIKPVIKTASGQSLLLFKPNDTFTMGASRREQGRRANEAQRNIRLDRPFYLSQQLVTNAEYRKFDRFHSSGHVKGNSLNGERYPVVNITWQKAALYCNWLSEQEKIEPFYQVTGGIVDDFNTQAAGYRLPTEAEWAWSARLKQGTMQKYAWGTQLPPTENSGNFGDRQAAALLGNILLNYDDRYAVSSPVGKFPPNHRKLYDLSGNAAEWINDYYGIKTGLSLKAEHNPMGPASGDFHVIRGSSWAHATMTDLRLSFRDYSNDARNDVGFRIAKFID